MYLCGLQTFSKRQRWENAWQSLCHHRLSASWRTYHDEIMSARCCHLQCSFHTLLSTHISKIKVDMCLLLIKFPSRINAHRLKTSGSIKKLYHLGKRLHAINIQLINHRCFTHILFRYDESFELLSTSTNSYRQSSAHRLQPTVQSKFTHQHIIGKHIALHIIIASQNAYRQRQIKTTSFFTQVGWRHIDRYIGNRKFVAIILQCGSDTVSTFSDRLITQAREMILHTARNTYFYSYSSYFQTIDCCRECFYQHNFLYFSQRYTILATKSYTVGKRIASFLYFSHLIDFG